MHGALRGLLVLIWLLAIWGGLLADRGLVGGWRARCQVLVLLGRLEDGLRSELQLGHLA